VAITLRPIVPQPVDALPRRYVLRLRTWRGVYLLVFGWFVLVVGLLAVFTGMFS
jgi:hypothetical protein